MAGELEIPAVVRNLPTPHDFGQALRLWLDTNLHDAREQRGEVLAPEDTFDLVRKLQRTREVFSDYAHVLNKIVKETAQEIESELASAVGEDDGVPRGSLVVPDIDGSEIRLSLSMPNSHTIDVDPLYGALATLMLNTTEIQTDVLNAATVVLLTEDMNKALADLHELLVRMLALAMQELLTVGNFTPQVTKVRALAKALAGLGLDDVASTVTKSIRTKKIYSGVTVKREQSK